MARQPTFDDLGKCAKDLLTKGPPLGVLKISAKKPNLILDSDKSSINYSHNFEDSKATADFDIKSNPIPGLTTSAKIDSSKVVSCKIEVEDKLVQGLKVGLDGNVNLDSASKQGSINAVYAFRDCVTTDLNVGGGDEKGGELSGGVVVGNKEFYVGCQGSFNISDKTFKKNNVAAGYKGCGFLIHADMVGEDLKPQTVNAYAHAKFKNNMEAGVFGKYVMNGDDANTVGIGLKYLAGGGSVLKATIDNAQTVSIGCEMKLSDAATFTVGTQMKGSGESKVGASLEFNAI